MKKLIKLTSLLLVMAISLCTLFACGDDNDNSLDNADNSLTNAGEAYVIEGNYEEVESEDLATQITKILNSDQMKLMMNSVNQGSLSDDVCASMKMNNLTKIKLDQTEVISSSISSIFKARVGKEVPTSFDSSRLYSSSTASISIDDVLIETLLTAGDLPADVITTFKKDYTFGYNEEVYCDGQNVYSNVSVTGVEELLDTMSTFVEGLGMPAENVAQIQESINVIKANLSGKSYVSVAEIIELVFGARKATETGVVSSPVADESIIVTPNTIFDVLLQANALGIDYLADLSNNEFKIKLSTTNKTIIAIKSFINEQIAYIEAENAEIQREIDSINLDPEASSYVEYLSSIIDENNITLSLLRSIVFNTFSVEVYAYANSRGEIVEATLNYDFDITVTVPTTQDGQFLNVATKGAFSFTFADIPVADFVPAGFNASEYTKSNVIDNIINSQPVA